MMRRLFPLIVLCVLGLISCQKKETTPKPTVVVSIPPYVYFVKKIAHDFFDVHSLVPPKTDPHTYEPSPREVEKIQNPILWIKLGEAFDQKVEKVFNQRGEKIKILDITEGLDLLSYCQEGVFGTEEEHCHHSHSDGQDRHVWMSLRLAKIQAQNIAATLSELYPEQTQHFEANLQEFLKEIDFVDEEISQLIAPMRGKAILVSHPAFGYFCRDYDILQLSIEMQGKEPLPQHVTKILNQAKQYQITSIIIEPQTNNKGAELIARELKLPTHMIDPCAENYTDNLLTFAKLLID